MSTDATRAGTRGGEQALHMQLNDDRVPERSDVDVVVRFAKVNPRATLPQRHSALAAGMDLCACLEPGQTLVIEPIVRGGRSVLVPLGFVMALPAGFEGQVRPRSGLATKHGITLPNAPGTIDADYRGQMFVPLVNLGQEPFIVEHGLRIAQLVIARVERVRVVEVAVDRLDETERGSGGFGSTGL